MSNPCGVWQNRYRHMVGAAAAETASPRYGEIESQDNIPVPPS